MIRCEWARLPLEVDYHDREWGVPLHDDQRLFELLILEGAQAGLSWSTILAKRDAYRAAYDGFDPALVARYDDARLASMLTNAGLVRNRLKLRAAVTNARVFLTIQSEWGTFDSYLWSYVDGAPIVNEWAALAELPASTPLSEAISRDLRKRGMTFVGPTIIYAYLQAVGVVDDHTTDCFRRTGGSASSAAWPSSPDARPPRLP